MGESPAKHYKSSLAHSISAHLEDKSHEHDIKAVEHMLTIQLNSKKEAKNYEHTERRLLDQKVQHLEDRLDKEHWHVDKLKEKVEELQEKNTNLQLEKSQLLQELRAAAEHK